MFIETIGNSQTCLSLSTSRALLFDGIRVVKQLCEVVAKDLERQATKKVVSTSRGPFLYGAFLPKV